MAELRNEIIEGSKARFEFLKWKLIGVSALGAAGLGLGGSSTAAGRSACGADRIGWAYLMLTLIPLVCFYVDLLCRHMALRIGVIGNFLRISATGDEAFYERFVDRARRMGRGEVSVFGFEDLALLGSTVVLSLLVALVGVGLAQVGAFGSGELTLWGVPVPSTNLQWIFVGSGALGAGLTWMNRRDYLRRSQMLKDLADDAALMATLRPKAEESPPAIPGAS